MHFSAWIYHRRSYSMLMSKPTTGTHRLIFFGKLRTYYSTGTSQTSRQPWWQAA
jgi:hypothetical protein